MKVAKHVVDARRQELANLIRKYRYIPVQEISRRFQISEATARRDLRALEDDDSIIRTFGGAMGEYDRGFASFRERLEEATQAKQEIAQRGIKEIKEGMTIFIDAGTTLFSLANTLLNESFGNLHVVTNNLPVAEVLSTHGQWKVTLTGGDFLGRQSVMLGEIAHKMIAEQRFDLSFLSAQGMNEDGLWNTQPDVISLQKVVMVSSQRHIYCLDHTKINVKTDNFLANWREVDSILTNANPRELTQAKINITQKQFLSTWN